MCAKGRSATQTIEFAQNELSTLREERQSIIDAQARLEGAAALVDSVRPENRRDLLQSFGAVAFEMRDLRIVLEARIDLLEAARPLR
jgi:hypothetical protein